MKNLVFFVTLTLAFVVGWKLGVITVQPDEAAVNQLLGRISASADRG